MRPRRRIPVRYSYVALAVLMAGLAAACLLYTGTEVGHLSRVVSQQDAQARAQAATIAQLRSQQAQLRRQQLAACGFASLLGSLPVPDSPKPGKTGVILVADSRDWYRKNDCPGALPVPPGFSKWAASYRLPADLRR